MRAQSDVEQTIRRRASEDPGRTWLKWKDEEFSWREVLSLVQRTANGLIELGVKPGERVAILMGNRPEFLWTHLGIMMIGALSVPVNISQRGPTLRHILADSDATTVVLENDLRDPVLAIREGCPSLRAAVVLDGPPGGGIDMSFDRLLDAPDREPEVSIESPPPITGMLYTSGTTGPPKGVVRVMPEAARAPESRPLGRALQALGVRRGETMYTGLPLFHSNALLLSAVGSIMLDAKLALAPRFSASRIWDDCRRYEAVEFNSLGGMISILLKQPPRPDDADNPVRAVLSAGCPPDRWKEFEERFGIRIVECFGMVDAPGLLLNAEGKVGSMGKPVGESEFAVVDEHDHPLGPNEVGELVFRLPQGRASYYHKRPDATEEAYRGGWFHTGDLASRDEEGFFYYRGRRKESIRRLGENISAWEIETVVNQHPQVLESAAFGVTSELGEEEVALAVIARVGERPTPMEILDFCQGKMAHYAVPRYVEFVDDLPKTPTQRIRYAALKEKGVTPAAWDRQQAGYDVRRR